MLVLYELMNPILCKLKAGLQFEMPLGQFIYQLIGQIKGKFPTHGFHNLKMLVYMTQEGLKNHSQQ